MNFKFIFKYFFIFLITIFYNYHIISKYKYHEEKIYCQCFQRVQSVKI